MICFVGRTCLLKIGHPHAGAIVAACLLFIAVVTSGHAAETSATPARVCEAGVREQDQVFLLSTRNLACSDKNEELPSFAISRWEANLWKATPHYDFVANDPGLRTIIYVHGNRVDASFAIQGGMTVYRQLVACAGDEPIRFIIWSWCSDQIRGPRRDAKAKACTADEEGILLGRFIHRFPAGQQVGLIGFSFGARMIATALHLVGGGEWQGVRLPAREHAEFHTVLWAAAVDNNWLLPGCPHGCAVKACQHWLITINNCDESLKFYHRLERRGGTHALGFTGIAGKSQLGADAAGIRECTVQHLIGASHLTLSYPNSAGIMTETRRVVLTE